MLKKKTWWKDTGALLQDAMMDGLQCDPSPFDSPYTREMKRRIWCTIRELDLQNTFEYGVPTIPHTIETNAISPMNINDESFDQKSGEISDSTSANTFTATSYQYYSTKSWELRLKISRLLYGTGTAKIFNYEDVLRYTHEITQLVESLPKWDVETTAIQDNSKLLTYAYLNSQLKECLSAIHRPYLQQLDGKFWLSENITHQISRDVLLLQARLGRAGIQSLSLLREDLLLASLSITRITLLQPNGKRYRMHGDRPEIPYSFCKY